MNLPERYSPLQLILKRRRSRTGDNRTNDNLWQPRAVIAGLLVVGSALLAGGCAKKQAPPPMPPPDVSVVTIIQKDVPAYGDWVTTLDGYVNAQIQPQVSGYLVKQNYREGSFVRKDAVLFEIDPRPFQALLDQAKGQLAQARSQVLQAQSQVVQSKAQLEKANLDVKRDTPLAQARAIAQSQLDTEIQAQAGAAAGVESSKAAVEAGQANVEAAKASVAQAELNLGFTKVRSLIDGIAGIAQLQIGNLVSQTSVLTTVSQVSPIKAFFPLSEQEYLTLAEKIKPGSGGNLLQNAKSVPLELTLTDGSVYPHKGTVAFADRQVDNQTGTIRIAGVFPNPGNLLRPGQFGRIKAVIGMKKDALLVPQRAVSELQGKYQVAVVGQDNKVSVKNVTPGIRVDSLWVISEGLKPEERVVTEGLAKIRDGVTVNPKLESSEAEAK